jgi:hypothetical protein
MIEKLNKNLLGLVIGIVSLTFFAVMADAGSYGCYGYAYPISDGLKSWSQKIPAKQRFVVLKQFNCEAVLDKETQLVWVKSPGKSPGTDETDKLDWYNANFYCYGLNFGGRGGFRLPTVEELRTLVDPNESDPALPPGHPFDNVQSDLYWSSTTVIGPDNTDFAWSVSMGDGNVDAVDKTVDGYVWCVRGGHGYDGQ